MDRMDTMLDYEAEKSTYMVTVTATDDSDAPNEQRVHRSDHQRH